MKEGLAVFFSFWKMARKFDKISSPLSIKYCKHYNDLLQLLINSFLNYQKLRRNVCLISKGRAVQKHVNLEDLVKGLPTSIQCTIHLQKSASVQPRTSLSKSGGGSIHSRIRLRTSTEVSKDGQFLQRLEYAMLGDISAVGPGVRAPATIRTVTGGVLAKLAK